MITCLKIDWVSSLTAHAPEVSFHFCKRQRFNTRDIERAWTPPFDGKFIRHWQVLHASGTWHNGEEKEKLDRRHTKRNHVIDPVKKVGDISKLLIYCTVLLLSFSIIECDLCDGVHGYPHPLEWTDLYFIDETEWNLTKTSLFERHKEDTTDTFLRKYKIGAILFVYMHMKLKVTSASAMYKPPSTGWRLCSVLI